MPLRTVTTDKHALEGKGFRFMGPNGTVEFVDGKTRYHISIHGEGNPAKWDRFHVKIYDLRFGPKGAGDYDVYFQIANAEGNILVQNKGVVKPGELTKVKDSMAEYMGALA